MKLTELSMDKIVQTKNHRETYHEGPELASLMGSIKNIGLQNPIHVIESLGGKYSIISGHRRFNAAKKLKLARIPVLIEESPLTKLDISIRNLMENLIRKNPSPIEYGLEFQKMMAKQKYNEKEIGQLLSMTEDFVKNCLYAARKVPKQHRPNIVALSSPNDKKKGDIPISAVKAIETAKKSKLINTKEGNQLYKMAKDKSVQKVNDTISSIRKGAKIKEALKENGKNKIEQVTLRMDFFKKDIGPDKDAFAEKLRARIYKEFGFKRP